MTSVAPGGRCAGPHGSCGLVACAGDDVGGACRSGGGYVARGYGRSQLIEPRFAS